MLVYFIKAQTKIADQPGMVLYGTPPRWHKFNPAVHTDQSQIHYHAKKTYEIKAAQEMAGQHADADAQAPEEHVAAMQAKAQGHQAKASASAAVTGWKQALTAGKAPSLSQAKAFHALAQSQPDKAAKLMESVLDVIGKDKYMELLWQVGTKLVDASKAKPEPKPKAKPEAKTQTYHVSNITASPLTGSANGSSLEGDRGGNPQAPTTGAKPMTATPADLRGLDRPETYANDLALATLARRLAEKEFAKLPAGTVSRGDLKREYLEGKRATEVAAALDAEAAAKAKSQATAAALQPPPGYSVTTGQTDITVKGPFHDSLHASIKRAGGRWDGATKSWRLPVAKSDSLRRILANFAKVAPTAEDLAKQKAEANRHELLRWLGYVEEKATDGYLYENGIAKLRELGIDKHPDLHDRLAAAIAKVQEVKAARAEASAKARRVAAISTSSPAPAPKARRLFPVSALPPLDTPYRAGGGYVVFTGFGQPFRITEDHPSMHGSHLLGHEGETGRYAYYRPATEDEITEARQREQQARQAAQQRQSVKDGLRQLEDRFTKEGERPVGPQQVVEGERLLDTQTLYGGGDWWVIQPDAIWYVKNNGADGDDWSYNNVRTGGAGAIGWKMPRDPAVEAQLREADAMLRTPRVTSITALGN